MIWLCCYRHHILIYLCFLLVLVGNVIPAAVPVGGAFPFSTGVLKDTNSCSQNYKTACTNACKGDILTFSGCDGSHTQDTYFKLYYGSEMVAFNDDYCNSVSLIQYMANVTGCNEYCLRMGCFGLASCSANVTATIILAGTQNPTYVPTHSPTIAPTEVPTSVPTSFPVGGAPSSMPSTGPTSFPTGTPVLLQVDYFEDTSPSNSSASKCYPESSGQCNLRSAWMACLEIDYVFSECIVEIPSNVTVEMDSIVNGELVLSAYHNIHIRGAGFGAVIRGKIGGPGNSTSAGGIYPVSTGVLSNTDSDSQNYVEGCVQACVGDILTFSACDGDTSQDTYFRLFLGEQMVAYNDDHCDSASYIEYTVISSGCSSYCLHIGCFGAASCSANVTATVVRQSPLTPRFIYYLGNNSLPVAVSPKLALYNLVLTSFGGDTYDGGALYLNGVAEISFEMVEFRDMVGAKGGSVYISHNDKSVVVHNCTFVNSIGSGGGGICLDQNVMQFRLLNSLFDNCTATSGGGLLVSTGNENVNVYNCSFHNCRADGEFSATGGGITIDSDNRDFFMSGCSFDGCRSTFYGGSFASLSENFNSTILYSVISNGVADYGGGVFVGTGSSGFTVGESSVINCTGFVDGGGIYLYVELNNVNIFNSSLLNNYAGNDGGKLFNSE